MWGKNMKKIFLFIISLFLMLFSCKNNSKNTASTAGELVSENSELQESELVKSQDKKPQFSQTQFIVEDVILYEEGEEGKMYYAKHAGIGDYVLLYLTDDGSIEQKEALPMIANNKESYNFVHINYEDKSFWVRDFCLSGKNSQKLFFVLDKAFVYAEPQDHMITSKSVDKGSFVALADGGDQYGDFYKCIVYDKNPFGKEVYLRNSSLSDNEEMIEIALVFQKLKKRNSWLVRDEVILNLINALKPTDPIEYISYLTDKIKKFAEKEELAPEVWSALENLQQAQKNEKSKEDEFLGGAK